MGFNLCLFLSDVLILGIRHLSFVITESCVYHFFHQRKNPKAAKHMIRVWICGPSDPWLAVKTGMMLCIQGGGIRHKLYIYIYEYIYTIFIPIYPL